MASRMLFEEDEGDEEEEEEEEEEESEESAEEGEEEHGEPHMNYDEEWLEARSTPSPSRYPAKLGDGSPEDYRSGSALNTFKPLASPQCSMDDDSSTDSEEEVALEGRPNLRSSAARSSHKPVKGSVAMAAARRNLLKQEGGIAAGTSRIVSTPTSFTSSEQQPAEREIAAISKRKAMIEDLASKYHADCLACCRELLTSQRQWRQELQAPLPGRKVCSPIEGIENYNAKDVLHEFDAQCLNSKSKLALNISPESSSDLSADASNSVKIQSKSPLRRHLTWRANEREALRRGLLMFGLGRSEKIRCVMKGLLKQMRLGFGDIADCCWEFVRICGIHADEKERAYAQKLYAKAEELGIETGPEVGERVGQWERIDKSASVWLRRLRLLDSLREIVRVCANAETQEAVYDAIDSLGDAAMPCEWWGKQSDLALLAGVYKHGFGNYEAIRVDLQFAEAFGLPSDGNGQSRMVKGDRQLKTGMPVSNNWETSSYDRGLQKGCFSGESDPSSQHGLDMQPSGRDEESISSWPDANILTRRLKRLVEHIVRMGYQVARPQKGMLHTVKQGRICSKREKLNFLKSLLTWGLPITPGHGGDASWQFFRDPASVRPLRNKRESNLEACYEGLIVEMKQILEGTNPAQDKEAKKKTSSSSDESSDESLESQTLVTGAASQFGPTFLTYKSAVKLKDRLELFSTVRQALEAFPDDWTHLGLDVHQNHNLPSWWQSGYHDKELVLGILKHGFGNWNAIFQDNAFSLKTAADPEKLRRGCTQDGDVGSFDSWGVEPDDDNDDEGDDNDDDDDDNDDDEHKKINGKRSFSQVEGPLILPSSRSLVKRLKFVGNSLSCQLKETNL